jgi:secondary thiamine-phosphate synthase enzyme
MTALKRYSLIPTPDLIYERFKLIHRACPSWRTPDSVLESCSLGHLHLPPLIQEPQRRHDLQVRGAAVSEASMLEFIVTTTERETLVDITGMVERALREAGVSGDGLAHIFSPHTTAGITVNEGADPSVARDIVATLRRLVPHEGDYRHGEGNSDAHLKTALVGTHAAVPMVGGALRLGTWQSIYLAEFDGPRRRKVWVQVSQG